MIAASSVSINDDDTTDPRLLRAPSKNCLNSFSMSQILRSVSDRTHWLLVIVEAAADVAAAVAVLVVITITRPINACSLTLKSCINLININFGDVRVAASTPTVSVSVVSVDTATAGQCRFLDLNPSMLSKKNGWENEK